MSERQIIHPELPDDPRGMIATGQLERALDAYAHQYIQSAREQDLYIASACFEAMYQVALSRLSEGNERPFGRQSRTELTTLLREAVDKASEEQYDREDFQTNLEVCQQKYRPKRQRGRKAESET